MASSDQRPCVRAPRLTGLWRDPGFMKLWTGQTISTIGSHITGSALQLTALLVLGAGPSEMGALAAAAALPALALGLVAGVWVDRLRRRPIMIGADLGRALLLLTIPVAALLGRLGMPQLYAVVILAGALTIFFDVAYRSFLPALVGRANVVEGNTKLTLSTSAAEVGGPALGGLLVQVLTGPIAVLFDALSFLVSAISIWLIRKPEPAPASPAGRRHILRESCDGLGFVARQPLLRAFAGSATTQAFFGNFYAALYGLYAIRVLGLGPAALGLTVGMGGIGNLAGAALAPRIARRYRLGAVLVGSLAFSITAGLLIPLARGPVWVATACLMLAQVLGDGADTVYAINEISLRQAVTPDHFLGRANATQGLLATGVGPLGALAGGLLAEALGVRSAVWIAATGQALAVLWLVFSPVHRLRAHPTPPEPEPAPLEPADDAL